jgi:hypothetical protein
VYCFWIISNKHDLNQETSFYYKKKELKHILVVKILLEQIFLEQKLSGQIVLGQMLLEPIMFDQMRLNTKLSLEQK